GYITDSSNRLSDYRRNFLRNEVIPLLETRWPGVKNSINKTASIMEEEEEGINGITDEAISGSSLLYSKIKDLSYGKWLLRRFVKRKGGSDFIVEEMWRSLSGELKIGAKWYTRSGFFIFSSDKIEWVECEKTEEGRDISEEFEWKKYENRPGLIEEIKGDRSNRCLWTSVNPSNIIIRTRKKGDRMRPLNMKGSRLISDMIKESGLPAGEKEGLGIAEDIRTGEIIWLENVRRSGRGLVSPDDKTIWKLNRRKFGNS
ncbi:MAG: tRNA lysidine(34) synthetase TilS, partial [Muribaculaceae bacterium]|nr:tRNA lysidine(34) synthetase TilS [Muribaculaceae bacterium]